MVENNNKVTVLTPEVFLSTSTRALKVTQKMGKQECSMLMTDQSKKQNVIYCFNHLMTS